MKFDVKTDKRRVALRDYVIYTLEMNPVFELSKILEATETKFDELKDIILELATLSEGICRARSYPDTRLKAKLSDQHMRIIRENWVKL